MLESSILFRIWSFHLSMLSKAYAQCELDVQVSSPSAHKQDNLPFVPHLGQYGVHEPEPMHSHELTMHHGVEGHL